MAKEKGGGLGGSATKTGSTVSSKPQPKPQTTTYDPLARYRDEVKKYGGSGVVLPPEPIKVQAPAAPAPAPAATPPPAPVVNNTPGGIPTIAAAFAAASQPSAQQVAIQAAADAAKAQKVAADAAAAMAAEQQRIVATRSARPNTAWSSPYVAPVVAPRPQAPTVTQSAAKPNDWWDRIQETLVPAPSQIPPRQTGPIMLPTVTAGMPASVAPAQVGVDRMNAYFAEQAAMEARRNAEIARTTPRGQQSPSQDTRSMGDIISRYLDPTMTGFGNQPAPPLSMQMGSELGTAIRTNQVPAMVQNGVQQTQQAIENFGNFRDALDREFRPAQAPGLGPIGPGGLAMRGPNEDAGYVRGGMLPPAAILPVLAALIAGGLAGDQARPPVVPEERDFNTSPPNTPELTGVGSFLQPLLDRINQQFTNAGANIRYATPTNPAPPTMMGMPTTQDVIERFLDPILQPFVPGVAQQFANTGANIRYSTPEHPIAPTVNGTPTTQDVIARFLDPQYTTLAAKLGIPAIQPKATLPAENSWMWNDFPQQNTPAWPSPPAPRVANPDRYMRENSNTQAIPIPRDPSLEREQQQPYIPEQVPITDNLGIYYAAPFTGAMIRPDVMEQMVFPPETGVPNTATSGSSMLDPIFAMLMQPGMLNYNPILRQAAMANPNAQRYVKEVEQELPAPVAEVFGVERPPTGGTTQQPIATKQPATTPPMQPGQWLPAKDTMSMLPSWERKGAQHIPTWDDLQMQGESDHAYAMRMMRRVDPAYFRDKSDQEVAALFEQMKTKTPNELIENGWPVLFAKRFGGTATPTKKEEVTPAKATTPAAGTTGAPGTGTTGAPGTGTTPKTGSGGGGGGGGGGSGGTTAAETATGAFPDVPQWYQDAFTGAMGDFATYYADAGTNGGTKQALTDFQTFVTLWSVKTGRYPTVEEASKIFAQYRIYLSNLGRKATFQDFLKFLNRYFAKAPAAPDISYLNLGEM